MTGSYTAASCVESPAENAFRNPLMKINMAERDEQGNALLITEAGCSPWVRIPLSLIDDVISGTSATCHDPSHPLVEIRLKDGPAGNEAATGFAARIRPAVTMNAGMPPGADPQAPPPTFALGGSGEIPGSGAFPPPAIDGNSWSIAQYTDGFAAAEGARIGVFSRTRSVTFLS